MLRDLALTLLPFLLLAVISGVLIRQSRGTAPGRPSVTTADSAAPAWVQAERAHIRRVLAWTMAALSVLGCATLGLLMLKTRWALVPGVGLALCQFGLYYAMVRQVRLGFRIKRSGAPMPPPPLRAVLGLVFFGALSFTLGILGVIQKQGPQIFFGLLGGVCMTIALLDLWRKQRQRRGSGS